MTCPSLSRCDPPRTLERVFAVYKFGVAPDWNAKYRAEGRPSTQAADYVRQPFVQTILQRLPPGSSLLDAGCGTGGLLGFFNEQGYQVSGVDTAQSAVAMAQTVVPTARVEVASLEALPFPAATFDAYLAIGSWEYLPNGPVRAAHEAARVLKPGGLAFIEVPHVTLARRLLYIPLKRFERVVRALHIPGMWSAHSRNVQNAPAPTPRFAYYLFRISEIQKILTSAAFKILATHPHDLPEPTRHYGLWVDCPLLRAATAESRRSERGAGRSRVGPYELNALGLFVKRLANALSPWTIATGMFMVARKR